MQSDTLAQTRHSYSPVHRRRFRASGVKAEDAKTRDFCNGCRELTCFCHGLSTVKLSEGRRLSQTKEVSVVPVDHLVSILLLAPYLRE